MKSDPVNAAAASADHGDVLLDLYDDALPEVYGYLQRRVP